MMERIKAWATIAVALTAVLVPAATAKPKQIKLKGVVVGQRTVSIGGSKTTQTVVSVRMGSKKVGKLFIGSSSCAGNVCQAGGTANLKVGKIKGKAQLGLRWTATGTGCPIGAPTCHPAKFGTGKISTASSHEAIRVNASKIPKTKGSHFGIVLG